MLERCNLYTCWRGRQCPDIAGNKIAALVISRKRDANATSFVKCLRNILAGFLFRIRQRCASAARFRIVTLSTTVAHAFPLHFRPCTFVIYRSRIFVVSSAQWETTLNFYASRFISRRKNMGGGSRSCLLSIFPGDHRSVSNKALQKNR